MKRAFLDAYNRELGLLYERSREFAEDYPGIAERLGGLTQDNMDPAVGGLLEGAAFMAARVQLKMSTEFDGFTAELLNQLLPNAEAPTPSAMLVAASPDFENPDLAQGQRFEPGAYLDARYVERDQRISCRYRLSAPLELWPLELTQARFVNGPATFQALGLEVQPGTAGGLQLSFERPGAEDDEDAVILGLALDQLPVHLVGDPAEMVAVYEQLFCTTTRITLRYLNSHGDPIFVPVPPGMIEQIGFDDDEALFPEDTGLFRGFSLLREFFIFPQKFLGFRMTGLRALLGQVPATGFDLLFEMDTVRPTLPARIGAEQFRLYCAPAVNLFEENCSHVKPDAKRHEHLVSVDSSPASHYEVHRITDVFAYYPGVQTKVPVYPLYGQPADLGNPREALYFTARQRPRRLTQKERRFGKTDGYTGTETFLSLYEPATPDSPDRVKRLQIKTLCSNRHLPEYLPLGQDDAAEFRLNDDVTVGLRCVAGPTAPRESVPELENDAAHRSGAGPVNWRLISYLSLNHLGLDDRGATSGATALRELLSLFTDPTSTITDRQLSGLKSVASRPVVRSIQRGGGYHAARGIEVTLGFDERAFEGTGIMLIGAVLDRFLAEYASVNSFTQVVISSTQRGVVKTWAPRTGQGPLL